MDRNRRAGWKQIRKKREKQKMSEGKTGIKDEEMGWKLEQKMGKKRKTDEKRGRG